MEPKDSGIGGGPTRETGDNIGDDMLGVLAGRGVGLLGDNSRPSRCRFVNTMDST